MAVSPYLVVFPLPVQGHINPFTSLADYFVSCSLSVTFVYAARTFSSLSHNRSSKLAAVSSTANPRIEVVPDGLPVDRNANISPEQFFACFPLLEKGLDEVLLKLTKDNGFPPSCIVTDSFMPYTQNVADKHGIPRIEFCTLSATAYAMLMHCPELAEKGYLPMQSEMEIIDFIPGLPPFPMGTFPSGFSRLDVTNHLFQFLVSAYAHNKKVNRVLVNSFCDLEPGVIEALRAQRIPIEHIGPMIPLIQAGSSERLPPPSLFPEDRDCLDWLDAQQESSVLYVSFGSIAKFEDETLQELALGLELSQEKFLWVIRPNSVNGAVGDLLPQGFQSRTKGRSRIVSWAPQVAVLAHPAVGAFFTHCGWNSTMESLAMGIPMIGFPNGAEQNTNLKHIEQWEVGMALDEQGQGGVNCNRGAVERTVRAMMRGEGGDVARRRSTEWRDAARKAVQAGSSKANLEKLVEELKCGRLEWQFPIGNSDKETDHSN